MKKLDKRHGGHRPGYVRQTAVKAWFSQEGVIWLLDTCDVCRAKRIVLVHPDWKQPKFCGWFIGKVSVDECKPKSPRP